jgi:hypothetical protein
MKLFEVVLVSSEEMIICNVGAETEEKAIALLKEKYDHLVDDSESEEEYDEEYDDKLKIHNINSLEGVSCTHEFVSEIHSNDHL